MTPGLMRRAALYTTAGVAMLVGSVAQAVGVPGQGTWETTLQPRELDGDLLNGPEAFYDTALNITWLRNANANGLMDWATGNTWANSLTVGGVSGWRLPTVVDTGAPGCDYSNAGGTDCGYNVQTATSELAHLFYVSLGNLGYCPPGDATCAGGPQPGYGLTNTGGFQNLQSNFYWSGTEYSPDPCCAWYFGTSEGRQVDGGKVNPAYAVAVRPGDVAAVPEPQAYALMLLGTGALLLAVRRRPHRDLGALGP